MRRLLLPILALTCTLPAAAQETFNIPTSASARVKTVRELMTNALEDPAVQVQIHVTDAQRQLQTVRIAEEATKNAFGMLKAYASEDEEEQKKVSFTFGTSIGKHLYPFLAANQIAILKRIAIARDPVSALGTDEVSFALDLSEPQKNRIEAIRMKIVNSYLNSNRPSSKALASMYQKVASIPKKDMETMEDEGMSAEKSALMDKIMSEIFRGLEKSIRLRALEKKPKEEDPLKLLTPQQLRRFYELTGGRKA